MLKIASQRVNREAKLRMKRKNLEAGPDSKTQKLRAQEEEANK